MTVDAVRAFGLGIPAVEVSVASAAQVRALAEVAKDWHRSGAGEDPHSDEDFTAQGKRVAESALIIPGIESPTAIDEIDEILDTEDLRSIFMPA